MTNILIFYRSNCFSEQGHSELKCIVLVMWCYAARSKVKCAYAVGFTCEGHQVRQAEAVGQDDELHGVQVRPGTEASGVQVLQHRLHAAARGVGEEHLQVQEARNTDMHFFIVMQTL